MYAIIEDSGTQIKLKQGDLIDIDLRDADDGAVITFDRVLAIGDASGTTAAKIGRPYLTGAVRATARRSATASTTSASKFFRLRVEVRELSESSNK